MPLDTHEYSLEPEPRPPDPEPDPERRRRWPRGVSWPAVLLAIGVVLLTVSAAVPPLPAWVMIIGACGCIGRGLLALVPESRGLRDHRQ